MGFSLKQRLCARAFVYLAAPPPEFWCCDGRDNEALKYGRETMVSAVVGGAVNAERLLNERGISEWKREGAKVRVPAFGGLHEGPVQKIQGS